MNKLTLSALVAAVALIAAPTYAADVAAGKKIAEGGCAIAMVTTARATTRIPPSQAWPWTSSPRP